MKVKKNWALRVMVLALAFTLLSTCLMSGTLAKYVAAYNGRDTARVAKWGVEVTASGSLFATTYPILVTNADVGLLSVITNPSGDGRKLVAPGTGSSQITGSDFQFSITGTPEVASRIAISTTGSSLEGWDYDLDDPANGGPDAGTADYYEPIQWSINNTPVAANSGGAAGSFGALLVALEDISYDAAPNTDLSTLIGTKTITWEWDFAGDDAGDTYYGNKATAPQVNLVFTVTVTQID